MSAAQVAGGPVAAPSAAVEAPEADAPAPDIGEALEALAAEQEAAAEADPEAPEAPEADPEAPADKPPAEAAEDPFSDKALSTAAGVKAAAAKLRELRHAAQKKHGEMKVFERKLTQRETRLKNSVQQYVSEKRSHDLLLNNVHANLQGLHSGDPEQMVVALGGLTGQDGIAALELLNSRLLHKGRAPLDPQVQALLDQQAAQIQQLTEHVQGREQQQHAAGLQQQIESHAHKIVQMVAADDTLPHLAGFMRDDPQGTVQFLIGHIEETGGRVPAAQLFKQLEAAIVARLAPQGGNGTGPVTKNPVPKPALRSPGQSIGPRSAAAAGSHREPSEEEALQALASDPGFLSLLGR